MSAGTIHAVTACVRVDLSNECGDGRADRWALHGLEHLPAGARVVVDVGSRTWMWPDTARELHRAAQRLVIELECTPRADVRRWLNAVRTGRDEVIA